VLPHSICNEVLGRFPKKRPILPAEYAAIHREQYFRSRCGLSLASRLSLWTERWMHSRAAADAAASAGLPTLEIGPGTLNHLPFEPQSTLYDIVEPFRDLYADSPYRHKVRSAYDDIRDLPEGLAYQRIVSVATFEHLLDLPAVVARSGLLLSPGGCLRVGIPSEGSPLWRAAYRMTTGYAFWRRYQLDYDTYMRYEHVNSAREIGEVLRYFFRRVKARFLGLSSGWSLYQFYVCTDPDLDRCRGYWREWIDGGLNPDKH
jgi:hypothetical protein